MRFFYNLAIYFSKIALPILALFNPKIRLFVQGRKDVFSILEEKISHKDSWVWVHAASLGEFEQGLPIIRGIRQMGHKVLVTFFSPSGYEVKKNSPEAELITYLPLDTPANAQKFLAIVRPCAAIFVKYEFWANYLTQLKKQNIPTYLVSGIFRKNQIFFKPYGGFMRAQLKNFTHLFVQNPQSEELLQSIGIQNVTVSGDTRFDRVCQILTRQNNLPFMNDFTQNAPQCVVLGSTWQADEEIFLPFINAYQGSAKFVIAPHQISPEKIENLQQKIQKKCVRFSQMQGKNLAENSVLILDTVGILTKVYSYASVAYVGGGMGNSGLHNVLEPAVFGIAVIIGKNYEKFAEARALVQKGGIISVRSAQEFASALQNLLDNPLQQKHLGAINQHFIKENSGATQTFLQWFAQHSAGKNYPNASN